MSNVTHRHSRRARRRAAGISLVEVLVGVVVLTVGLLGTARWQAQLRQTGDLSRQQGEALRLARQDLERLRAWSGSPMALPAETRSVLPGGAQYTVVRRVNADQGGWRRVAVAVEWTDAQGALQQLRLDTAMVSTTPAAVLALTTTPAGRDGLPRDGRHPAIPAQAHPLDARRSVFKPRQGGQDAWVFDHRSGRIVLRCSAVPAAVPASALTAADLAGCEPSHDLLLSGRVRFMLAPTSHPFDLAASDPPVPMDITLQRTDDSGAAAPLCLGEAAAWPGSPGPSHWAYHCVVPMPMPMPMPTPTATAATPHPGLHWSGRLRVRVAAGGAAAAPLTVCRHAADLDASGALDHPGESPDTLVDVDTARVEQNFLVVDASRPCPLMPAASTASGEVRWSHANIATRLHAP